MANIYDIRRYGKIAFLVIAVIVVAIFLYFFNNLVKDLSQQERERMEIWEANLAETAGSGTNQFKGRYFRGYLNEFTLSSSAEDHAEYECTFAISDAGVAGNVTVSAEQQEAARYVFSDTSKTTGA